MFKHNFCAPRSRVEGPVRFAVGQTALGRVLVGRSRRGICAILLGDDAHAVRAQLAAQFPGTDLQADRASLRRELDQVIGCIGNDASQGVIDLDIGGSEFEQKVWRALCGIPAGKTRSYGEIARDLGIPQAVRAVAGACAANALAIAVPCHRVVRSDGSIAGYRWGVERKRALLIEESAAAFVA